MFLLGEYLSELNLNKIQQKHPILRGVYQLRKSFKGDKSFVGLRGSQTRVNLSFIT